MFRFASAAAAETVATPSCWWDAAVVAAVVVVGVVVAAAAAAVIAVGVVVGGVAAAAADVVVAAAAAVAVVVAVAWGALLLSMMTIWAGGAALAGLASLTPWTLTVPHSKPGLRQQCWLAYCLRGGGIVAGLLPDAAGDAKRVASCGERRLTLLLWRQERWCEPE